MKDIDEQFGIGHIGVFALRLNVGGDGTSNIGTLVPCKTTLGEGAINNFGSAFYKTALVSILYSKDKSAACIAGNEPGIESGAQIADVHIAGGAGGETGTNLALGNTGFHSLKIKILVVHLLCVPFKRIIECIQSINLYFTFEPKNCQEKLLIMMSLVFSGCLW